jgi:predicted nucleic acid-binding protein
VPAYLDSSAAVKLVFDESESEALQVYVGSSPRWASSALIRVELLRAAKRLDARRVGRAYELLGSISIREIDDEILDRAAEISPLNIRTLDAIHLATATLMGPNLEVLVTYDRRMIEAAQLYGLPIASPA